MQSASKKQCLFVHRIWMRLDGTRIVELRTCPSVEMIPSLTAGEHAQLEFLPRMLIEREEWPCESE